MGQNYSSAAVADGNLVAGIDVPELADISYERSLGSARFLKTIRAKHPDGFVVVKSFAKPLPAFQLEDYRHELQRQQRALEGVPNAFAYQRVIETDRAGYLVRQYLYSSLYDRISIRPFLEDIEKRWIAFQLLCGLRDCHAHDVHHGDIKAENVLVTSWNWIYLSDFAPFKPTYLPEDNPADFSYYFDTSGRRICYVAPERFLAGERRDDGKITDEMDVFSLGCVIAELFLEGTPLFTLSQLFKYRTGEYDPMQTYLSKIEDVEIRSLIHHMTNLDPSKRFSAEKYLNQWRKRAFPEYFYSFLHQYVGFIMDPTAGRVATPAEDRDLYGRADDRIERIYHDFDKIAFFLGFEQNGDVEQRATSTAGIIPVHLDIPNYQRHSSVVRRRPVTADDGTLIFLSLVASSMRNTSRATARVRACDIMLAFGERITDEAKMDRCLPYLITLLGDDCAMVQVAAIRTITQLMELVEVVSPVNSHVFREYILPKMQHCVNSRSTLIRATYASCLSSLASTASRFLDVTQALRADGVLPTADPEAEVGSDTETAFQALYDTSRSDLILYFQEHSKLLLTDEDSAARRAFLRSVSTLCVFFGAGRANDIILSHLNTYLNDKDWMLRCAFFETITGVAAYVGGIALEEYIMPLMVQSLTDPEEFVVEKVLRSLATMASMGLFQRSKIWELVDVVCRFTMHPNIWIREGAVAFIAASTTWLSPADVHCIVYPLVKPFLRARVVDLSALNVLENLKKPLSRTVFDMAANWAAQSRNGEFWRSAQVQRTFSFGSTSDFIPRGFARDVAINASLRVSKNDEDEGWLRKLRNLGMSSEDEWKLTALREYIWRMARSRPKLAADSSQSFLNSQIALQELHLTPQTIFFDDNESFFNIANAQGAFSSSLPEQPARPASIADALLDASKTIDYSPHKRNQSRLQLRRVASDINRSRLNGTSSPGGARAITPTQAPPGSEPSSVPTTLTSGTGSGPTFTGSGESSAVTSPLEGGNALRRKSSVVSMLTKGIENSKAAAATSTVSATAFGKMDAPFARDPPDVTALVDVPVEQPVYRFRGAHSYDGNDPYILSLLDSMYMQNFPSDIVEFGPTIVPVQRRQLIKKSTPRTPGTIWKPEGVLVAQFGEHNGAINKIAVAPDHTFFLTGSEDGTVKLWDSSRLEKNVAFKARQTYQHGKGGAPVKVKCLCFIENTRCFASGASDGSIHVVKVDYQATLGKYGKLRLLRNWQLPENERPVWLEHFKADSHSLLLIATDASNVHALDLRSMQILYTLRNPVHHGTPTCFVLDRKHNWMVLGTARGILDMWDLRFQLRLKAWGLPGSTPIHRLALHPTKGRGKWIVVAGGTGSTELSVWDIEKTQCREVYRAGTATAKETAKGHHGYEPWAVDDESSEALLSRFTSSISNLEPGGGGGGTGSVDRGIRAIATGVDVLEESLLPGFIISAGADRKVRFWNCAKIESSAIVCGPDADEQRPIYVVSHPSSSLTVNTERFGAGEDGGTLSRGSTGTAAGGGGGTGSPGGGGSGGSSTGGSAKRKTASRTPRSTVISMQQQQLLKSHLDSILDVALLEVPYGMIVSADRSGMVFIYQ